MFTACSHCQISKCRFYIKILITEVLIETAAYPTVHKPNGHCAGTCVTFLLANKI